MLLNATQINKNRSNMLTKSLLLRLSRKEATRTPDPYVPNVVRYQLRYFPIFRCKGRLFICIGKFSRLLF